MFPGGTYYGAYTLSDPSTGAAADADSAPTVFVYRNGVLTNLSMTSARDSLGRYIVSGQVPSSYSGGDTLSFVVGATVGGIYGERPFDRIQLESLASAPQGTVIFTTTVIDPNPTVSSFLGNPAYLSTESNFYSNRGYKVVFPYITAIASQVVPIVSYDGPTRRFNISPPLTQAPVNGAVFNITT